jgi:hypothetical protein
MARHEPIGGIAVHFPPQASVVIGCDPPESVFLSLSFPWQRSFANDSPLDCFGLSEPRLVESTVMLLQSRLLGAKL